MSKEFNLLTFKYDVITGQCNVCDIRENVFFTNFHSTVVSQQVRLVDVYACLTRFFLFFSFSPSFASLRCFALYYTVLYCLSGEYTSSLSECFLPTDTRTNRFTQTKILPWRWTQVKVR